MTEVLGVYVVMDAVACLNDRKIGRLPGTGEQTSRIRVERVLAIRDQIAEGRYRTADRLNAVLDRILEDLLER